MPKASPNQTSFSGGEFSPLVQGRVDTERYKTGLEVVINYLPTLQGPLVRRPGSKYIADVKDPSNPPTLIPFQFSDNQSYMLEFGNQYVRFFANEGEVITNTNVFKVNGIIGIDNGTGALLTSLTFNAVRTDLNPKNSNEGITGSSLVIPSSILELTSPYTALDVANIKFTQSGDTLYLAHSSYVTYKLQRFGQYDWSLKPIVFKDGPYLPLNSYKTINDSARVTLTPSDVNLGQINTGPNYSVYGAAAAPTTGYIRLTTGTSHVFASGDNVCVRGVPGTVEANNGTSSVAATFWPIRVVDTTHIDLVGSTFSNAITGSSGIVSFALFEMMSAQPSVYADAGTNTLRTFALIKGGIRYWGVITGVTLPSTATYVMYSALPAATETATWQMGVWSRGLGYPSAVCLHQDRLVLSGAKNYPQELDLSKSGDYETFAASGSSLQVADNNACQFKLVSAQSNPIRWVKSSPQGLLAGASAVEWQIAPNNQNAALTPTNVNAVPTSFFGSANIDAVQAGNAVLYVQSAYRKLREMNYFFQVGTFRSTDLTELSEHITIPGITKLAVQKEPLPLVWACRADGVLLSMTYNRDDQTLKAGWARHVLGGQSDSGGSPPEVKSIGVITASSATFDQLWMTVKRYINGTSAVTVEVLTSPYNDSLPQEDGYCLDAGATFESPKEITALLYTNGLVEVASFSHGFSNGSSVLITDLIGANAQTTDVNGVVTNTNLVNEKTFIVASAGLASFFLQDFQGGFITSSSFSPYVSGGRARKLITHVSGVTWLKNETVGVVTDGGIHQDVVVNSAGVLTLQYPAAKVQFGYRYNSDGATLRSDAGAAAGSSIGMLRRITKAAFLLHQVGDFSFGPDFARLIPCEFPRADEQQADQATPLFSGITRDSIESSYDFDDQLSFRQNSGLPGMVQSVMVALDEVDV